MEYDYDSLLKRGRTQMPSSVLERERFEIPKARGHFEGNKTIISNFRQIATQLRRPEEHLLKYILKELAAPGDITKTGFLVLGTKIPATRVNDKVKEYATEFVLCSECGKPDTDIKKEGDFHILRCSVCGAKKAVKSKI